MITEKIILTAIICGTLVVLSIVGTIGNYLKRKEGKDNERKKLQGLHL